MNLSKPIKNKNTERQAIKIFTAKNVEKYKSDVSNYSLEPKRLKLECYKPIITSKIENNRCIPYIVKLRKDIYPKVKITRQELSWSLKPMREKIARFENQK